VKNAVAQDAGIVDQDVDAAEGVERRLYDLVAVGRLADRQRRGDRLAAGLFDLVDDRVRRPASVPAPSRLAPMSQTTTRAPSCAINSAMPRPMPRPAPVTMATLPSTMPGISNPPLAPPSWATSTIIRSLAHCSSSARILPSSVEAKPHCGDRQSWSRSVNLAASSMRRLIASLRFERAGLRRHQAEHREAALRQPLERLEAAGARGVVFHEIAVHLDPVEQHFLHGVVAARAHEGRFVVAAAQMHGHRHVGGMSEIAVLMRSP
jgi:hypothetical protein